MKRPNILIAVYDTARAASCSVNGYHRHTTPILSDLASEGVRYVNAISPAPWTLPAHVSLFTGQYCVRHGVDGRRYRLAEHHRVMAELLNDAGYDTAGISSNIWISDTFGFHRGFDYFFKTWQFYQHEQATAEIVKSERSQQSSAKLLGVLRTGRYQTIANAIYGKFIANRYDDGARAVTNKALEWLRNRNDQQPFFLFLNYLDPHAPYLPPHPYRRLFLPSDMGDDEIRRIARLSRKSKAYHTGQLRISQDEFDLMRDLYDAEITYTDAQFGRVLAHLDESHILDDTIVIALSDHGENIGDHGLMAHRFSLHQSLVHVPFVIRYPAVFARGESVSDYVQLTDVLPTLLDLLAQPDLLDGLQLSGTSLLDRSALRQRPALSEYLSTDYTAEARSEDVDFESSPYNHTLRAFFQGPYKLVERVNEGEQWLYNVQEDPHEQKDLAASHPDVVHSLRSGLSEFLEYAGGEGYEATEALDVSDTVRDRLRALGYLG